MVNKLLWIKHVCIGVHHHVFRDDSKIPKQKNRKKLIFIRNKKKIVKKMEIKENVKK